MALKAVPIWVCCGNQRCNQYTQSCRSQLGVPDVESWRLGSGVLNLRLHQKWGCSVALYQTSASSVEDDDGPFVPPEIAAPGGSGGGAVEEIHITPSSGFRRDLNSLPS